jgi:hypothetical protein
VEEQDYEVILWQGVYYDRSGYRKNPDTGEMEYHVDRLEGKISYMASQLGLLKKTPANMEPPRKAQAEEALDAIAKALGAEDIIIDEHGTMYGTFMDAEGNLSTREIDPKQVEALLNRARAEELAQNEIQDVAAALLNNLKVSNAATDKLPSPNATNTAPKPEQAGWANYVAERPFVDFVPPPDMSKNKP